MGAFVERGMQRRALISVLDKITPDLSELGGPLHEMGWGIHGSEGTVKYLREKANVPATDIATIVGFPPVLKHRVVSLSHRIHGGLLARDTDADWVDLDTIGAHWYDLVCVGLYDTAATMELFRQGQATLDDVYDNVDMGGVALLRSAAKGNRIVIGDPADREQVINELLSHGDVLPTTRARLRRKAFRITANYDTMIADFLDEVEEKAA